MSRVFHGCLAVFFLDKLRRCGVFFFFWGGGLGMSCFFPVFSENIKSSSVPDAATFSWGEVVKYIFQLVMVEVRNGNCLIDCEQ